MLIPLSKGQFAKVDDADYDMLSAYTWHARWNPKTQSYYAARNENIAPAGERWRNRCVKMHRQLLGLEHGDPRQGDHENGDTLDHQRNNLRKASASQNAMNRKKTAANTSGYKGVYLCKNRVVTPWKAFIKRAGVQIHLGYHETAEAAHAVRCAAASIHHGAFARSA